MGEDGGTDVLVEPESTEEWLSRAQELVLVALDKAREVKGFPEQLQSVSKTLNETIEQAELCMQEKYAGKLRMQSDLDALSGKLDLNLRDCGLLIKTGVLGEVRLPSSSAIASSSSSAIAKCFGVLRRSNIAALVQLLTATSLRIREKTVTVICSLAESGSCENWLVSEGVLPPLIRLVESGSAVGKEKAAISLQRLSMSPDTARSIVGHGGVRPVIEICRTGDSVSQAAAACTLKNLSAVAEVRQNLAEEGIINVMINLLDCGLLLGSKEYAAECLQNLTLSNENLKRSVVSEGGIRSLLAYLDGPLPQESAVGALRNLISSVSVDVLVSLGLIPRLVHVLRSGSLGAQQAAASAICKLCSSSEMKKSMGESGCIPLLVKMLEAKTDGSKKWLHKRPQNTTKKYAISCLGLLSSSKKCKKLMVSYGAIGYLKKLSEMDIPGAKKLLERLERGKLRSLFNRK
ncbi:ARM repeat superfamily protein [Actinidia rufa]|uniref:ARM repeat superfamily protein n=1 Tax=Actinidia rufa TaxID=165716 RepID=A0A7J0DGM9_9ERIC|nr:ARM repeat superfamily protein [Actinidia rufa]